MNIKEKEIIELLRELSRLLEISMSADGDCLGVHWNDATDALSYAKEILEKFTQKHT